MNRHDLAWLALLVLGAGILVFDRDEPVPAASRGARSEAVERLVPGGLASLARIDIERDGHVHALAAVHGEWVYQGHRHHGHGDGHDHRHDHGHDHGPAPGEAGTPAGVAAAPGIGMPGDLDGRLGMLAAARIERRLAAPADARERFGLTTRRLVLHANDGAVRAFRIGARTPDGFGTYLLDETRAEVVILPAYQVDNLDALADAAP